MKKYVTILGILLLLCLSFIITDKTANIVLDNDDLMLTIKNHASEYEVLAIDGIIDNENFIPGISGRTVNLKQSYNAMKKYGVFMGSLLSYDEIKPKNRLKNNYDKYIVKGNSNKKIISLIFLISEEDDVSRILEILKDKNVRANFFIDGYWLEKHTDMIKQVANQNHNIGNLSYNHNYNDGSYIWMDTIIKKNTNQKYGYCYTENPNETIIKICALNKNYTIMPENIIKNNFLSSIKQNLNNGMIISLIVNDKLINELPVIIEYIKFKGYDLDNLENLLNEK